MKKFKDYLNEVLEENLEMQQQVGDQLDEKLITFGGKAYPKFNQIVILAGGAGSGKGFVLNKLLGIEGKVMDVDALKALAIASENIAAKIKEETGEDIKNFDLRVPENVSRIHELISDIYGITGAKQDLLFKSIQDRATNQDRKPNVIFDVTLKDISKLEKLTRSAKNLGYKAEDIHIVWVVNDVNVAIDQNAKRSRVVPEEILMTTHEGVSLTMRKVVDLGDNIKKYMDGDIWFAFNKAGVDTKVKTSDFGGMYIEEAEYIQLKKKGQSPISYEQIGQRLIDKIQKYTPETKLWK